MNDGIKSRKRRVESLRNAMCGKDLSQGEQKRVAEKGEGEAKLDDAGNKTVRVRVESRELELSTGRK